MTLLFGGNDCLVCLDCGNLPFLLGLWRVFLRAENWLMNCKGHFSLLQKWMEVVMKNIITETWQRNRSASTCRGGRVKRQRCGWAASMGRGLFYGCVLAVVFRNWTAGELLPQVREYFPYADESVGLTMQKTSTCALFYIHHLTAVKKYPEAGGCFWKKLLHRNRNGLFRPMWVCLWAEWGGFGALQGWACCITYRNLQQKALCEFA